jgi:hypothetical protein
MKILLRSVSFICFLVLMSSLFSCCKSNKDAYNSAYRILKQKSEDDQLDKKAKTAMTVSKELTQHITDTTAVHKPETITLVAGEPINLSDYSIVTKSFINKTNARSYQSRMEDDGYPAVLVQNEDLMFRIIIASFKTESEARARLVQIRQTFPEAWVLVRK